MEVCTVQEQFTFRRIMENIFLFRDICNVYALIDGNQAILINFGSGRILSELCRIGVDTIKMVIHTSHHRDLCIGDELVLGGHGAEIAVPKEERQLFSDVENFWQRKRIYVNYALDSVFFSRTRNIECKVLENNETIEWKSFRLKIINTPGDSRGAISVLCETGSKAAVFCGGLIAAPGKVSNIYDFQWEYMPNFLFDAWKDSLEGLLPLPMDFLCPSQGIVMENGKEAIGLLVKHISDLKALMAPRREIRETAPLTRILPHLIFIDSSSYLLLSDSGHGILIDWGEVESSCIDKLVKDYGLKKIDAIVITHYHDDHLSRALEVQLRGTGSTAQPLMDTQIWTIEELQDILKNPRRYNLPCLFPANLACDRIFKSGSRICWEEYELHFYHHPGQTYYALGLFTVIDGYRLLFTGDNFWPVIGEESTTQPAVRDRLVTPVIFKNQLYPDCFLKLAQDLRALNPEILATGHYGAFQVGNAMFERYEAWALDLKDKLNNIILQETPLYGVDCRWACFYPYICETEPGEEFKVWLRIRNHRKMKTVFIARINPAFGFYCADGQERTIEIDSCSKADIQFVIRAGQEVSAGGRYVSTADISIGGVEYGPFAEFITEVYGKRDFL